VERVPPEQLPPAFQAAQHVYDMGLYRGRGCTLAWHVQPKRGQVKLVVQG
jgi:hypothetical protein